MAGERRRWSRLGSELRVGLSWSETAGGSRRVEAIGTHLSPEGIFVQLADPPEAGTPVVVTADLDGVGPLSAEGVVTERVVIDDGSDRMPGVGLKLSSAGAAWRKLYDWLKAAAPA